MALSSRNARVTLAQQIEHTFEHFSIAVVSVGSNPRGRGVDRFSAHFLFFSLFLFFFFFFFERFKVNSSTYARK